MAGIQDITRRGRSILDDIAGTAGEQTDLSYKLLEEACKTPADWGCVFAALVEDGADGPEVQQALAAVRAAVYVRCAAHA